MSQGMIKAWGAFGWSANYGVLVSQAEGARRRAAAVQAKMAADRERDQTTVAGGGRGGGGGAAAESVPEMGRRVLGHALSIDDPFAGNSLLPGRMPAANVRNDDPFGGHILFDARKPVPANVRSVFDLAPPTAAAQQSAPISSRRPVKLTSTGNLTGNFQLLPSYGEGVAAENAAEMRRQIIQLRTAGDSNWGDQGYIVGVSP